ncbi:hypothetical protein PX039_14435 [Acinetobacter baumannii]|uniref:hypothetical protein n=1 Tax=Acinetobacter baumannii TaxID=470 RepID=UPI000BF565E8|nr:hypothetical protein [Acinetobacter baumannii]EME5683455.1 hypothetical protein [Acinetobacter baumannii]HEC0060244.1 hypothetical protein [Acinetobacter baumannii]HEC0123541.1 hypothetical protein [Acinetobacter baumannii]HEC0348628.1 hypothetical protein [Acinetobacter baumannii]HEC0439918.1 hypothetical protein [Acinetobacter baumannii]
MKAIQFKKTGQYTGNCDEVARLLGGTVTYVGQRGREANKTYERDGETFPIQFDDWLVDIEGVILVLNEKQYQALNSVAYKPMGLGEAIARHVNKYLNQQQRQGGLLSK